MSALLANKPLPPRLKIPDAELTVAYLKGSGPGGQKIVRLQLLSLNPNVCYYYYQFWIL